VKFGLHLDNAQNLHPDEVVNSWLEWVTIADTHGFDYVSVVDHLVPFPDFRAKDLPLFDPWQMLAAIACQTRHVKLLTLVSNASVQHPAVLAKRAATLDVISAGRMVLGLGAGGYAADETAVGALRASQSERYARLEECIVTLQKLWTGKQVTHQGQFINLVNYTSAPTPRQTPRILIAGKSRAILELAARRGSASNFAFTDPAKTQILVHRLSEALSRAGKSVEAFDITLLDRIFVAKSDAQARDSWKNSGSPRVDGHPGLIGGPETLALKLRQLSEAGVNTLFGMFSDATSLQQFCTDVIPRLRQR
jgi:alkanesulfonate monooxygenase SsuD/methylene tetrahydromethanopterin reductase-like flavin-dependent oxidoreductase (luciferase family)